MPRIEEEYRMEITEKIIEALENGTAPWQKPWLETYMPVNATTGKRYSGMNSILLSMKGDKLSENGDPRWATRKQAEKIFNAMVVCFSYGMESTHIWHPFRSIVF